MFLVDTHCHLNHERFENDRTETIERALEANVRRMLVVGYDLDSSRRAVLLARQYPAIEAVIGIHPETVLEDADSTFAELTDLASDAANNVVAWGEIGLDYYWGTVTRDLQRKHFERQVELAGRQNLPIVIHCRDAYSDMLDILGSYPNIAAELHCFTGSAAQADQAVTMGLFLGVGGIITFKKSDELRTALANVPLERILLETDCPYLAPQAFRGKRNEPAYLPYVARQLAQIRSVDADEISQLTTLNAERFFGPGRKW